MGDFKHLRQVYLVDFVHIRQSIHYVFEVVVLLSCVFDEALVIRVQAFVLFHVVCSFLDQIEHLRFIALVLHLAHADLFGQFVLP